MKRMYGYIRVSGKKQEKGASLKAQRTLIKKYAEENDCVIVQWFIEKKTAAKRGRDKFSIMFKFLKKGKADGFIIHKIDRGSRNLWEWAYISEAFDAGIDVRFAHDDLDLSVRGERLSADIQAVVAADYVRNLKEEIRKGIDARLAEGLYPFRAPIGYLDTGKGKVKKIDLVKGRQVENLFKLYASGNHSLRSLQSYAEKHGPTSLSGGALGVAGIHRTLINPFYAGIIKIKASGQTYPGIHKPIISVGLFEKVQLMLTGGENKPLKRRHHYLFRQVFRCHGCNRYMIGEMQKGRVYYRCQNSVCETKTLREDRAEFQIMQILEKITLPAKLFDELRRYLTDKMQNTTTLNTNSIASRKLQLSKIENRLERLADAYLDNLFQADVLEKKKQSLLLEKKKLEDEISELNNDSSLVEQKISRALELLRNPLLSYKSADKQKKREYLEKIGSNFFICGRNVVFELKTPLDLLVNESGVSGCAHSRNNSRKMTRSCGSEEHSTIMNLEMNKGSIKKLANELLNHYSTDEGFEKSAEQDAW